jgi:uncharacterized coiled-coil DUF342 family protein
MTEEVENLVAQAIAALHKLNEQYNHVTQTLIETKAELGQLQTERDQMKTRRDALSAEVGDLAAMRDHLLQILNSKPAKAA